MMKNFGKWWRELKAFHETRQAAVHKWSLWAENALLAALFAYGFGPLFGIALYAAFTAIIMSRVGCKIIKGGTDDGGVE